MEAKLENLNITDDEGAAETNVNIKELVLKLRDALGEKYPNLRLPPDGDNILERSLRHRKFDVTQAADQVHSYFKLFFEVNKMKKENLFLPSMHKSYFLDAFSIVLLKQRDPSGTPICYATYDAMPGETFCTAKLIAYFIMLLNELTSPFVEKENQGVIVLANLKGFEFAHVRQYGPSKLQACAKVMQGAIPVRFKGVHFINVPSIFLGVYTLLKALLKQKIRERMHLYGADLTEFYKIMDKSKLPVALDGDVPNEEAIDKDFTKAFLEKDSYYKDFIRYGYFNEEEDVDS